LGAAGQLGSELARLEPAWATTHPELPIDDEVALRAAFRERRPAIVFNCAAYNAVDRAEEESELAFRANAQGPSYVATLCRQYGSRLVHFSTNFVFDGELARPYVESDSAIPLSVYGRSKLQGEINVLDALPSALVIRTSALYGHRGAEMQGGSFPSRIVQRASEGKPVRVVSDQKVNPTYARELAMRAVDLAGDGMSGIVHVVGGGCCSWYEFAAEILEAAGVSAAVEPVASADYPTRARRPLNGCLASERVGPLRPWREALRDWARAVTKPTGA